MADDVYHVTFTKNLSDIQERGLDPLSQSLWAKQETGERYQQEPSVYGFTNPEDALNWAGRMKRDFRDEAGESGDYSIVRLKGGEHWEDDPSGDFSLTGHGGKSVRYQGHINPEDVVSITQLPEPARLNEEFKAQFPEGSYEEWIKYYGNQLREPPLAELPPKKDSPFCPGGDCYSWAVRQFIKGDAGGAELKHGKVLDRWGQTSAGEGGYYDHAWIEKGGRIYDWQTGPREKKDGP